MTPSIEDSGHIAMGHDDVYFYFIHLNATELHKAMIFWKEGDTRFRGHWFTGGCSNIFPVAREVGYTSATLLRDFGEDIWSKYPGLIRDYDRRAVDNPRMIALIEKVRRHVLASMSTCYQVSGWKTLSKDHPKYIANMARIEHEKLIDTLALEH